MVSVWLALCVADSVWRAACMSTAHSHRACSDAAVAAGCALHSTAVTVSSGTTETAAGDGVAVCCVCMPVCMPTVLWL